ncbi:amino acid adenylation domain-containing protein [Chitinophaga sp. 22536]|uniref:amino acid adenylation domain-containing protein n=1 Tax=unclassified Chitinophaga TaxID=2619133 RepID=UPI003F860AFE
MNKRVIHTIVDHHALQYPEGIAIVDADESLLTYAELKEKSDNCAFLLQHHHIGKNKVVAVFLPEGIGYITAILGVNKSGNIFMPLVPGYPVERLRYLLSTVKPEALLTNKEYLKEAWSLLSGTDTSGNCVVLDIDTVVPQMPLPDVDGEDSNYLIYTSGSTGDPKTIEGVHKSLSHFLHWEMTEFKLDRGVNTALLAPVSFDVSFRDIFIPLLCGGTLHIPERSVKADPSALLEWIGARQITMLHMVPSIFRLLIKVLDADPARRSLVSAVRNILLAGEPLFYRDVINWRAINGDGTNLVNLYGPSETTLAKIYHRIETPELNSEAEIVPLGFPLPNTIVLVLNDDNQICQIGEIGEICIKTPFRSKGYYNDKALTAVKFCQNPLHKDFEDIIYRTGDLGKYGPERNILIVGRKDNQVKIRGNRVELAEVEKAIGSFPSVTQVIVIPHQSENGDVVLSAYYTAAREVDRSALREHISNFLPEYMHPSYYMHLDAFPLNINGKVNRNALPAPEDLLYEQLEFTPPSNKDEVFLCGIFSQVLGLQKVGVNNSFFELGGHSLNAVKVISRIYKETNRHVSLKFFLEHPTVRLLAEKMPGISVSAFEHIPLAETAALYPVSHSQKRLLVLDQVVNELTAYNMVTACFFSATLDVGAFKQAFDGVIARHEVFRTRFVFTEGTFWQCITAEQAVLMVDLENKGNLSPDQCLAHEHHHSFNLYQDVLVRARLIRQQDGRYFFVLNIHHILSDGWSMNVFTKELLALYNACRKKLPDTLPPMKIQYKDYAVWQLARLAAGELDMHKAYWHGVMQPAPSALLLPVDMERTGIPGFEGEVHTAYIRQERANALRKIAMDNKMGLFPVLLSLIKVLLYVKSGSNDIAVGVPVAGRNHPDLEDQIGFYLNNVLLRTSIKRDISFSILLKQVHDNVIQALDHQDYPFDKLVEELSGALDQSVHTPFYSVLVVMNNDGLNISNENLASFRNELGLELYDVPAKVSKLDLTFFIMEEQEHIRIDLEYNAKLFKPATIKQYAEELDSLAQQVIENPLITLSDLSWTLSAGKKNAALESKINLISEDF